MFYEALQMKVITNVLMTDNNVILWYKQTLCGARLAGVASKSGAPTSEDGFMKMYSQKL